MEADTIIVRFSGEIGIKSEWTRRTYEKQLLSNIKHTLTEQNLKYVCIERLRGRFYIKTQTPQETAKALTHVFGVSSVSPATQTTSEFCDIKETALGLAKSAIKEGTTFAVRTHRVGIHSYSSMQLSGMLGEQILIELESRKPKVNLTKPDVSIMVEVRDKEAYVYVDALQGFGGFPIGTQARTVCLLSGGIDSPVACFLTMKRGSPTIPVYIDNNPYTDEAAKQKAILTAKKLKEYSAGYMRKMYLVPNGENMKIIQQKTPARFTCLMCKRLMYRIAEQIADAENAHGIITGEAFGEQASQTVHNLFAIDEAATRYPIHRPLLGFDKIETEAIARKIGTFQISTLKAQSCTAAPSMPSTQARLTAVKDAETHLDISVMVQAALKSAEIIEL
jgi:thiamine biosynthesis protein ThiI